MRLRPLVLVALAGTCTLAGCVVPQPAGLDSLESSSRTAAVRREGRLAALEASLVARVDGRATGRLPAVSVEARLASPDRVRFQVRWLLGTVLDLALRADTLVAWVPSERLGVTLAGVADTLGVRDPARFAGRALAASWPVPHAAWRGAALDSGGVRLAWDEGDERWRVAIDLQGRPREVAVTRGDATVTVRYPQWRGSGEDAWPARIEVEDEAGWVRLRLDVGETRSPGRAREAWFALQLPDDARRLGFEDLQRVLSVGAGR